ncbi:hypothetical protein GCM10022254_60130 [Actinomadura meridiana]|uniref:Uncharacterized protein n=1 Tax=Actinomadura meridiana TaxID=559626 RepID=A0ABP8CI27_9ACTN
MSGTVVLGAQLIAPITDGGAVATAKFFDTGCGFNGGEAEVPNRESDIFSVTPTASEHLHREKMSGRCD